MLAMPPSADDMKRKTPSERRQAFINFLSSRYFGACEVYDAILDLFDSNLDAYEDVYANVGQWVEFRKEWNDNFVAKSMSAKQLASICRRCHSISNSTLRNYAIEQIVEIACGYKKQDCQESRWNTLRNRLEQISKMSEHSEPLAKEFFRKVAALKGKPSVKLESKKEKPEIAKQETKVGPPEEVPNEIQKLLNQKGNFVIRFDHSRNSHLHEKIEADASLTLSLAGSWDGGDGWWEWVEFEPVVGLSNYYYCTAPCVNESFNFNIAISFRDGYSSWIKGNNLTYTPSERNSRLINGPVFEEARLDDDPARHLAKNAS
jgi:hypothetical protein